MPLPSRNTDSVDKPGRTAILRAFSDGAPAALIGTCRGGGIGRRAGFRCQWPLGRGSSSLLLGTITLITSCANQLNCKQIACLQVIGDGISAAVGPKWKYTGQWNAL